MALEDVRKGLLESQGHIVILLDYMHHDWIAARFVGEVLGTARKRICNGWEYANKVILLHSAEHPNVTRGYNVVLRFGCDECDEYLGVWQ